MEIKSIAKLDEKKKIIFEISGIEFSFLNALRRTIINDVPTLAIEEVEFRKNDSGLYDEIIANRLGLLPLKTDLSTFSLPKEGVTPEDMGASSKVVLNLKSKDKGYVYASEITCVDSEVKPVYPETVIVKLDENQELDATLTAVMGTGKEHTKWNPGSVVFFHKPVLNYSSDKKNDKIPVLISDGKGKVDIKKLCEFPRFIDSLEKISEGFVEIKDSDKDIVFCSESWGQISPEEMIIESTKILEDKISTFVQALDSVKT